MKSYVSLEAFIDPITGEKHNYGGGILLDRRVKDTLEHETITGYAYSEDTQSKIDDGYIALVECEDQKDNIQTLKVHEPLRTGTIVWMRKSVVDKVFNVPITTDMVFIPKEVTKMLQDMIEE